MLVRRATALLERVTLLAILSAGIADAAQAQEGAPPAEAETPTSPDTQPEASPEEATPPPQDSYEADQETPPPQDKPFEDAPPPQTKDSAMLEEELEMLDQEVFGDEEPSTDEGTPAAKPGEESDEAMPELREVTVRYKPEDIFRMGGSVQLLDEEQLQKFQYDDPNTVVLQIPGVYVRQEDGFGLRPNIGLRGASSDRSRKVTLMEDGVLFGPAPYSAPAAYYFPVVTRMTGIEVFKGPAAILYGPNTVGGAINYITRAVPEKPTGQIDVAYGRFNYIKAHLHYGAHNEWGGFLIEGIHLGTTGFKEIDGNFGTDNTGFQRSELMLKAYVNTKPSKRIYNRLEVKFTPSRERSNETYLGLTDEDFRADPYRRYAASQLDNMRWWRTSVNVRHDLVIGDHVALETTAYRNDFQRTWERLNSFATERPTLLETLEAPESFPNQFRVLTGTQNSDDTANPINLLIISNDRRFVVMGIQTKLRADFNTGKLHHEIESGLRFHYDSIDRFHPNDEYAMQNGQLVFIGEGPLGADNKGETQALAGYLVYGLQYRNLTAKPGVRVEYIRTFFDNQLDTRNTGRAGEPQVIALPGLGLQYTITDEFAVLAGVHRGFSPVSPESREPRTNPDPTRSYAGPELSINYEAGGRYVTASGLGFAELIGFFNDYSNITAVCTFSVGCDPSQVDQQFDGGRAFIGGIEALGGYTIPLPRKLSLPFRVTYTYTNATFRTTFDSPDPIFGNVTRGEEVPYVPRHVLNFQVGLERSFWSVYTSGTYFGSMREGQVVPGGDDLPRTDDYFVLDLIGRIRFEPVEAYVRLQNVTNTQAIVSRRPFGARPNPPLSAQGGVQVTF